MAKKILITDVTRRDAHCRSWKKWTRWGFTLWNAGAARPLTLVSVS